MKKLLSVIICVLLFTTLLLPYVSAEDISVPIIKVTTSKSTLKAGETVLITVSFMNYDNKSVKEISTIDIEVPINDEYFSFVEGSNKNLFTVDYEDGLLGSDFVTNPNNNKSSYIYMYTSAKPISRKNIDIVSFELKALKDVPASAMNIQFDSVLMRYELPSIEMPHIVVYALEQNDFPWDDILISGSNDKGISIEKNPDGSGFIIKSDNLKDVTVTITKGNKEAKLKIDTGNEEVLIKEESGKAAAYTNRPGTGGRFAEKIGTAGYGGEDSNLLLIIIAVVAAAVIIIAVTARFIFIKKKIQR